MTELEKMMRARDYVRKLADGIDPLTDKEIPQDSTYNNVRISRCMFYIWEILGKVIDNGGEITKKTKSRKGQYVPQQEDCIRLKPHAEPLPITKFMEHLQSQLGEERGKISREPIVNWLLQNKLIREIQHEKGIKRLADENGMAIGIQNVESVGKYGTYTYVYYNPDAQQIIIDALMDIFRE